MKINSMVKPWIGLGVLIVFGALVAAPTASAQQRGSADAGPESVLQARARVGIPSTASHHFWDGENALLFTGVAAGRALDFTSTQHFRRRGVDEALLTNGIVDNKPLFAGIEAAATAASVGVSYWLHHTGHHRLERWVSVVHVGVATFGDIRNYGLSNPEKLTILLAPINTHFLNYFECLITPR